MVDAALQMVRVEGPRRFPERTAAAARGRREDLEAPKKEVRTQLECHGESVVCYDSGELALEASPFRAQGRFSRTLKGVHKTRSES